MSGLTVMQRHQAKMTARGILTENVPIAAATGTNILIDGTVYFMLVGLLPGDVVTGAGLAISTAGSGMSTSLAGLYSASGLALTRVAQSADQGSSWNSGGLKAVPFSAAYTVQNAGGYYVAVLGKTATTMPTIFRGTASTSNNGQFNGSGLPEYGILTGQTALPSSVTLSLSGSPLCLWSCAY